MNSEACNITSTTRGASLTVSVTVRLFGTARQATGVTELAIEVPPTLSADQLARLVRRFLPELVGPVLDEETGGLKPSHTFNINGVEFIDRLVELRDGDQVLLFSSQAGG